MTRRGLPNPFPGRVKKAGGLKNVCPTHGVVEWLRIYQNRILCCQCDSRLEVKQDELDRRLQILGVQPHHEGGEG